MATTQPASPTPLRVLVVVSGWPSAERPQGSVFVAQEVRFLRERGVDVEVVTFEGKMNPLNYLAARRCVRRALRSGFDLVHGHFGQTGPVILGLGVPVVMTFHGSDLLGVIGRSGRSALKGYVLRAISRASARRADRVIVAGPGLVAELPEGIDHDLIPAGVDPVVFSPGPKEVARAELGLVPDRHLVLFSGSPAVPVKRYGLAAEAVRLLSSELEVELLTVRGVAREVVAKYMRACDVLLVTSTHESGPAMVKEALATDLRVVSVDVGDVRRRIAGLPGCRLCPDDRPETIAKELKAALAFSGTFEGRSAVADVLQDRLIDRLMVVYNDVLSRA